MTDDKSPRPPFLDEGLGTSNGQSTDSTAETAVVDFAHFKISKETQKQADTHTPSAADATVPLAPEPPELPEQGHKILDDLHNWLTQYVAYSSKHHPVAIALWAAHTHLLEKAASTPRLVFTSPEPECGKSRNLELLEPVARNAKFVLQMSPASLFRWVEKIQPTILLDEVDTVFGKKAKDNHEDLRALVNNGHRPGASVPRVVPPSMEVKEFKTFCPVALAGIGNLPDTIKSRSIIIPMRRRAPDETVRPFRERTTRPEGHKLRERLESWTARIADQIAEEPELPEGVTDRQADCWELLIAIADAAGGDWPERAREACKEIAKGRVDEVSQGVQLLSNIRKIFGDSEALETKAIVEGLLSIDTAPWGKWLEDKSATSQGIWLAERLKPFGIKPKSCRFGDSGKTTTKRGYKSEDFTEAWSRYLVQLGEEEDDDDDDDPGGDKTQPSTRNTRYTRNAPGRDVAPVAPVAPYGIDRASGISASEEADLGGPEANRVESAPSSSLTVSGDEWSEETGEPSLPGSVEEADEQDELRETIAQVAQGLSYPRVKSGAVHTVLPGEENWTKFLRNADGTHLAAAFEALKGLDHGA